MSGRRMNYNRHGRQGCSVASVAGTINCYPGWHWQPNQEQSAQKPAFNSARGQAKQNAKPVTLPSLKFMEAKDAS